MTYVPYVAGDNFKVSLPKFIPKGKSFEVSLVTSKVFSEADQLEIYIIPGSSVFLSGAKLWTRESKKELNINSVFLKKFSKSAYQLLIDFTDTKLIEKGTYFQILLEFGPINIKQTDFKVYGEFIKGEEILGFLTIDEVRGEKESNYLHQFFLSTYEIFEIAGKNSLFTQSSFLEIPINNKTENDLILDFWIKHQSFGKKFFKLIDKQNNLVECILEVNEYQMLRTSSEIHEQVSLKPLFISRNAWYHLSIIIHTTKPYIYFYCDGEEISKFQLQYPLNVEELSFRFYNETNQPSFNLEQLRLSDSFGSLNTIFQNKHFKEISSDSSSTLFQLNFLKNEIEGLGNSKSIAFRNIKLIKSDAPIFPKAPEINLKIRSNFYEIEWTGGDYGNVDKYVIERAIGNDEFVGIAEQNADKDAEKVYSQLCEKVDRPEIVYFRVKQVNRDKTNVYSEIVKLGQGIVEDVILEQNYPNPFNPKTQIEFELIQDGDVEVVVYNLAGKEVAVLQKGFLSKGIYQFEFDGSELPSGIYLYQVSTPQTTQTRKMILAK